MTRSPVIASLAGTALACGAAMSLERAAAREEGEEEPRVPPRTAELMVEMHGLHRVEVQIATIAEHGASGPAVRRFAREVKEDHLAADRELAALAEDLSVELTPQHPEEALDPGPGAPSRGEKAEPSGAIERLFLAALIQINEPRIRWLRVAVLYIEHEEVASYVRRTIDTLASHLDEARSLRRVAAGR